MLILVGGTACEDLLRVPSVPLSSPDLRAPLPSPSVRFSDASDPPVKSHGSVFLRMIEARFWGNGATFLLVLENVRIYWRVKNEPEEYGKIIFSEDHKINSHLFPSLFLL